MLCLRVPLQTDLCGLSVGLKHPSPMPVQTPIVFKPHCVVRSKCITNILQTNAQHEKQGKQLVHSKHGTHTMKEGQPEES